MRAVRRDLSLAALLGELVEGLVQGQQHRLRLGHAELQVIEADAQPVATAFDAPLAAGVLDEDAAHGLGRRGEEVPPAVPVLRLLHVHQPQVGVVDQGRRLQRLARRFLRKALGGQLAQLVVDQRQQLLGRAGVAGLDGGQDLGHLAHGRFLAGEAPESAAREGGPAANRSGRADTDGTRAGGGARFAIGSRLHLEG